MVDAHRRRRESMHDAGDALLQGHASLAETGAHLLHELLTNAAPEQWAHIPPDDVVDRATGYQYFYHAHAPAEKASEEHGHFHLFARTDTGHHRIDEVRERAFVSRFGAVPAEAGTVNLLCISLDSRGVPTHLFTVNRWVTGDRFLDADAVLELLDGFRIASAGPPTVNRLLRAVVQLFWPQVETLLRKRDEKLLDFRKRGKRSELLDDERTEVLTSVAIDIDRQMLLLHS